MACRAFLWLSGVTPAQPAASTIRGISGKKAFVTITLEITQISVHRPQKVMLPIFSSFSSTFTQAGINQTLHQINMQVSVDVAVLVLGETNYFTISSQVVIAETVIVGQVPETLFQTGG